MAKYSTEFKIKLVKEYLETNIWYKNFLPLGVGKEKEILELV